MRRLLLVALVALFGLLPMQTFAAGEELKIELTKKNGVKIPLSVGAHFCPDPGDMAMISLKTAHPGDNVITVFNEMVVIGTDQFHAFLTLDPRAGSANIFSFTKNGPQYGLSREGNCYIVRHNILWIIERK